jgi:hypothetical protein
MTIEISNIGAEASVEIKRIFPDNLQSHFVQNVVAQAQLDCFILSFFELWPPVIITDTEEEEHQAIQALTSIDAKCVARIVLTPAKMQETIDVLTENMRKHKEKLKAIQEASEE